MWSVLLRFCYGTVVVLAPRQRAGTGALGLLGMLGVLGVLGALRPHA